jgi:ATP-dependent exoDNAse (exonuclease V) beta subunit
MVFYCVYELESRQLHPAALLGLKHLIIDEFQDFNPMELRLLAKFDNRRTTKDLTLFVAGDDRRR